MDLGLEGKAAIVTGGSRGIGLAAAKALAAEGARLVLAALSEDNLKSAAASCREVSRGEVVTVAADLSAAGGESRVVEAALGALGRIDILVNCAGAAQGGVFWEVPDQVWLDALALKFHGTVRMMRAVVPAMRAQGAGRIVTVVGNSGKQPDPRRLPGAAANAALLAVTRGLAEEVVGDGIVVLALCPGPVKTERWQARMAGVAEAERRPVEAVAAEFQARVPMRRFGEPEEIARWVAFLASEKAGYATGTSVTVDGGMTRALA